MAERNAAQPDVRQLGGPVAQLGPVSPALGGATPGGVATHQENVARYLAELGVDVHLLATNVAAPGPRAWQAPPLGKACVYRAYAPGRSAEWLSGAYLRAVRPSMLAKLGGRLLAGRDLPLGSRRQALADMAWYGWFIRHVQPVLLHAQHPLERHLYLRLLREWTGIRVPLVVTLHSFFDEHAPATIERLMAPNLRHAERLIAVSRSTADQAIQLGADPSKVRIIRSGVDVERFQPRERARARIALDVAAEQPLVLFVGNLEPRKAVDVLLRAVALLPAAHLVVIGSGESAGADNQEPVLRRQVHELGIGGRVRFEGRVDDDALHQWLAAADVFALPSRSEAQGIAALEAMASGLPVVASAVGGLLDTIRDGQNGYLVPVGEPGVLAEPIGRLLADPALRARIGAAAREEVAREFSWRRSAGRTLDVYLEALGR